jgi:gluconolactonase
MIFASGLINPEGPVSLADGSWLCVEGGAERGCVTQISSDGKLQRVVARTGRPNGLAVDRQGSIWVAESKTPSLLRVSLAGAIEVVATSCDTEPFLFPNDLCFGPDGALYFTDSGVHIDEFAPGGHIRADYDRVHYDGRVYRVDITSGAVRQLDDGLKFANGIAFGADGDLYVNETLTGMIYRYRCRAGEIGPRANFGNVIDPASPPGWKGPDGMAFDAHGRLYVAVFAQRDVTVLGTDGAVYTRLRTRGKLPTNCAFALGSRKKLYVTEYELGQIEVFDVDTDGLPLHS